MGHHNVWLAVDTIPREEEVAFITRLVEIGCLPEGTESHTRSILREARTKNRPESRNIDFPAPGLTGIPDAERKCFQSERSYYAEHRAPGDSGGQWWFTAIEYKDIMSYNRN